MYELFLSGQAGADHREQVLHVLAGLTAMQPQRTLQRHAVYRPSRPAGTEPAAQVGGSQEIPNAQRQAVQRKPAIKDVFYMRLVQVLTEGDFAPSGGAGDSRDGGGDGGSIAADEGVWSARFWGLPEAGKRPVTQRVCSTTEIVEGDPHAHMLSLGFSFVTEYILEGHRFTLKNTALTVQRPLFLPEPPPTAAAATGPRPSLPAYASLRPVDESGAYLVEASICVQDGAKPELLTRAAKELLALQAELKGVILLKPVDRLALDSRAK